MQEKKLNVNLFLDYTRLYLCSLLHRTHRISIIHAQSWKSEKGISEVEALAKQKKKKHPSTRLIPVDQEWKMLRNSKPWPRGGKIFLDPLVSSAFILRAPPPLQQHKTPITYNFTSGYKPRICIYLQARARVRTYTFVRRGTHRQHFPYMYFFNLF
jgi:hypothetical protein